MHKSFRPSAKISLFLAVALFAGCCGPLIAVGVAEIFGGSSLQ
jgi:hypothetical protein